jgi:hypothetical protein
MEVGAAGALALYNYQTAVKNSGQGSSSSGGSSAAGSTGSAQNSAIVQALASVYSSTAGSSGSASLVGGIYAATVARGGTSLPFGNAPTDPTALGGVNSYANAALSLNSALALTAYSAKQNESAAASGANSSPQSGIQTAIQSAQASLLNNSLNLFG